MQTDPDSVVLQINGGGGCRRNVFSSPSITLTWWWDSAQKYLFGVIFPQNKRDILTFPINNGEISFPVSLYGPFGVVRCFDDSLNYACKSVIRQIHSK